MANKAKELSDRELEQLQKEAYIRRAKREIFYAVLAGAIILILLLSVTPWVQAFWVKLYDLSGFSIGKSAPLSIHVIDVGKADAIVLECEGHTAVLDAGTGIDGKTVSDYIARNHLPAPELVIASHPDSDHTGGIPQVLSEQGAGTFVHAESFGSSYDHIRTILEEKGIPEQIVQPGDELTLGTAKITVLGPMREYLETNSASLVLKLEYRDFSALFCGDMESDAERDLLAAGVDLSADLIKIAHHGSNTSSTEAFLKAVGAPYAVISVGYDNNHLPNEKALQRIESVCPYVFRTDTDGSIVFSAADGEVTVRTEK